MKYTLQKTETFSQWLDKLKDPVVRNKVLTRLDRASNGNFGDYKVLTPNVSELRFTFGAGLRVDYTVKKTTSFYYWQMATNQPNSAILKKP